MRNLLIGLGLIVGLGSAGYGLHSWQQAARADRPMLPVTFGHADHRGVNCVDCHHNFVDSTGQGLCFDCHKRDTEVNALIEQQFHDLCRDCHQSRQRLGEDSGPLRSCVDCHTADDAP